MVVIALPVAASAQSPGVWDDFDNGTTGGGFDYDDILINGHFDNDLVAWDQAGNPDHTSPAPLWDVGAGEIGGSPFGSSDGSKFASPWYGGGNWDLGTRSQLTQLCVLPTVHTGEARVTFEAIWAWDGIDFDLEWLAEDAAAPGTFTSLGQVDMGQYGADESVDYATYLEFLTIPDGSTHLRFTATGVLANGTWIDAGFDRASIVLASTTPEPASLGTLGLVSLLALRRRR